MVLTHAEQDCLWYHTMLSTTKFKSRGGSLQANTWERLCWGIWPRSQYTKSSWYVEQVYLYHQVGLTSQNSDLCILKLQDRDYVIQIKGLSDTNMWSYGFDTCWARLSMVPHDVIHHKIQIAWNFWSLQANTWERLCWGIWPRVCILSHHGM